MAPDERTAKLLQHRGPDCTGQHQVLIQGVTENSDKAESVLHATFVSTVLALRGISVVHQPLRNAENGSVLCWNGEVWRLGAEAVAGNDAQLIFERLCSASSSEDQNAATHAVVQLLSSVRGPYAFVFYDALHKLLYYGRDCLGRRSLLKKSTTDGTLVLSSVCDNAIGDVWAEVEADGIYIVELRNNYEPEVVLVPILVPHVHSSGVNIEQLSFPLPFPALNRMVFETASPSHTNVVDTLKQSLARSLNIRIQHVREAIAPAASELSKIAVLFSGGLDCTVLARMCHDLLPAHESIDLLNVAFENPRIHSKLQPGKSPYETCPDRITGRASFAELQQTCQSRRWRFVEINVPYTDTVTYRSDVMALMHPHNTEMDLSISYALYFASRGKGIIRDPQIGSTFQYTTSAPVLLSGLGADELFGGYQRHATAFARHSYTGLLDELQLDFGRLGKRNLGRDDRIISDSGREVRFPFLDEDFIALALELPVTDKCDFGIAQDISSDDPGKHLESGKRILRLLAWQLGMRQVAAEKKRAIQFGARTAKMETGKTKGTTVLV